MRKYWIACVFLAPVNAYAAIGFAVQDGGQPISDRRALIERLRSRAV